MSQGILSNEELNIPTHNYSGVFPKQNRYVDYILEEEKQNDMKCISGSIVTLEKGDEIVIICCYNESCI